MQHRRLRLGDILDDYCPRERRVTNHAVVAMIGDQIKQTRCTTCDAEHAYKEAQVPRRRKKETPAALYEEVLAQREETAGEPDAADRLSAPPAAEAASEGVPVGSMVSTSEVEEATPAGDLPTDSDGRNVEGPVHRPLIRATLPRPEGQAPARPAPDFTVRQAGGRNGNFMRGDPRAARRAGRAHGRTGPSSREDFRGSRTQQFQQHGGRHSADRRPLPPRSPRSGQAARPGKKHSR